MEQAVTKEEELLRIKVAELESRLTEAVNALVAYAAQLEWIESVVNGEAVGDFAESFPLVRKVADLAALANER